MSSAEELITDKIALNKTKTKIYPGYAKFRICTIDNIEELAINFQKKIDESLINVNKATLNASLEKQPQSANRANVAQQAAQAAQTVQNTTTQGVQEINPAQQTTTSSANPLQKYSKLSPYDFNENIFSLSSQNITILTAGDNGTNSSAKADLISLGNLNGKPVVTSTLAVKNLAGNILSKSIKTTSRKVNWDSFLPIPFHLPVLVFLCPRLARSNLSPLR